MAAEFLRGYLLLVRHGHPVRDGKAYGNGFILNGLVLRACPEGFTVNGRGRPVTNEEVIPMDAHAFGFLIRG